MDIRLNNISPETAQKVAEYLESIDYNESFIEHFLAGADKEPNPVDFIKKKYPDMEL